MFHDPKKQYRVIKTGFFTKKAYEVLSSVFGQLSDGRWENSPAMNGYWEFGDAQQLPSGEVVIEISNESFKFDNCGYRPKNLQNKFYGKSDEDIKKWLAHKVKYLAQLEFKDNNEHPRWDRTNVSDTTVYLSYDETITVADCYLVYEMLLGRTNEKRYAVATLTVVIGEKRSAEEEAAVTAHMAKVNQLQRQRLDAVKAFDEETKKLTDQINAETKKALDALQKTRMAERSALWNKLTEPLKAIGA